MATETISETPSRARTFRDFLAPLRPYLMMAYLTAFAFVVTHEMLLGVFALGPPRAWDGTGHYGIAQIYDRSIFPDTFGWTNAYMGGMPFPNFYPPLFFWCVSLLHHTNLLSFDAAFKLFVLAPSLLLPAAIWLLAWTVSNRNRSVAFWAGFLSLLPLIDPRFGGNFRWASGLDYFSTLSIGMYTQPLGFVLLILWYVVYLRAHFRVWRFALASALLALAVLANYLNGVTSTLVIAATLAVDLLRYRRVARSNPRQRSRARAALLAHAVSPFISAGLALFWLVPMFGAYRYLVTRPFTMVVFTPFMIGWYLLAVAGFIFWRRRPTYALWPWASVCFLLANILFFATAVSPRWYPLQANRFSPTLNFLLAVPVGYVVATAVRKARALLRARAPRLSPGARRLGPYARAAALLLLFAAGLAISQLWEMKVLVRLQRGLSFYPPVREAASRADASVMRENERPRDTSLVQNNIPSALGREEILSLYEREHKNDEIVLATAAVGVEEVLRFAREHRDGRYLVEIPDLYGSNEGAYDSRALNSYLGAQGNEALTVVFREASPNALFMYPQVNALSYNPDNFGFSSVLADDMDFTEQPLSKHLERVRFLGGRYLVINSRRMKARLAQEPGVALRQDFGVWSVFELTGEVPPPVRPLPYRPALLVSDFTVKGRRSNEYNFIRFAEEQFFDGWFDVLLVRAPDTDLDSLGSLADLNRFGAIILDTYDCGKCEFVYRQLHDFAQTRPLILMMSDDFLFNRIRYSIDDFPLAFIVERTGGDGGTWLDNSGATHRYNSSAIRQQWAQIRSILESHKVPAGAAVVGGKVGSGVIEINPGGPGGGAPAAQNAPVLISTTYHPNWQSQSGTPVYAANPMFMLAFVSQPERIVFARRRLDHLGAWASVLTLAGLSGFTAAYYLRRFGGRARPPGAAHAVGRASPSGSREAGACAGRRPTSGSCGSG